MKENLTIAELKNKCVDLKKNVISMIWKEIGRAHV